MLWAASLTQTCPSLLRGLFFPRSSHHTEEWKGTCQQTDALRGKDEVGKVETPDLSQMHMYASIQWFQQGFGEISSNVGLLR